MRRSFAPVDDEAEAASEPEPTRYELKLSDVHAGVVEGMFATDLAFLQDLYRRVNTEGHTRTRVVCPACQHEMTVDLAGGRLGES